MTHVCQTDFLLIHQIVQRDVQVSADTNLETCKGASQKTFSFSHQYIRTLACWVVVTVRNIFIMSIYESKNKQTSKVCVSLNVFCEQWTVAIQMISIFSWGAPVSVEWQKVSGNIGLRFSKESLEIPVKALAVCVHFSILAQCRPLVSDQRHYNK